ncbi:chitinase [Leuconostoc pseudomesenteroides]|uniref:chitinase n=1 Tax=Leuconostoc pseudomesenteroides TaxID=33968 RepID=UPI0039E85A5A
MTVYTKTITAGLALLLAGAPLVGTVSASVPDDAELHSNGVVQFADDAGALYMESVDDITFGTIDLGSLSDLNPTAESPGANKIALLQTSANPTGNYTISVAQTGDWKSGENTQLAKEALPIKYNGNTLIDGTTFVNSTTEPARGESDVTFDHDGKNFSLDLTGAGNLDPVLNAGDIESEVTWTMTDGV